MSKIRLAHNGKNIVLVGHMGAGKTTVGRKLSEKIDYHFIDTDEEIIKQINMTISDFFQIKGEKEFRQLEEKIIYTILNRNKKSIIALGGGSFESKKIRTNILNQHFSVWLKCSLDILTMRCKKKNKRPLLNNKDIRNELSKLDKERRKNYIKSNFIIDVSKKTKNPIVNEIINNFLI